MQTVKIGGVPEHFNLPWHLAYESGAFQEKHIDLQWTDYKGGTGAMTKALNNAELDMAVVLTEGAVKDIISNHNTQILQYYVRSPLIWGIHVPASSKDEQVADLKGKRFAISRPGSGSHLMAIVNAHQMGWSKDDMTFIEVKNLDGARKAFQNGEADAFMWERFTTQYYVDNGEFKRVGECETPWPCFVILARRAFIEQNKEVTDQLLNVINEQCKRFMQSGESVGLVAERYSISLEQAKEWFGHTEWATDHEYNTGELNKVQDYLFELGLIEEKMPAEKLCE